jgi:uncharacterized coiled-coil protein SlyX
VRRGDRPQAFRRGLYRRQPRVFGKRPKFESSGAQEYGQARYLSHMTVKKASRQGITALEKRLTRLERDVAACIERIEHLEDNVTVNIKRMAAIQAELDHLRAMIRSV